MFGIVVNLNTHKYVSFILPERVITSGSVPYINSIIQHTYVDLIFDMTAKIYLGRFYHNLCENLDMLHIFWVKITNKILMKILVHIKQYLKNSQSNFYRNSD